jgi:hypothetical protein
MATPSGPPSGFDPEAHQLSAATDNVTVVPAGTHTVTDWIVTKHNPDLDSPISCWHCYTYGDVTWCVEIDCPFPQPPDPVVIPQ